MDFGIQRFSIESLDGRPGDNNSEWDVREMKFLVGWIMLGGWVVKKLSGFKWAGKKEVNGIFRMVDKKMEHNLEDL